MRHDLNSLGKYAQHVVAIYRRKLENGYSPDDFEIPFDRDDLDWAEEEYGFDRIKNPADLPYNLRGRASLPDELASHGYDSVIQDVESERQEAAYLITKQEQIIDLPHVKDSTTVDPSDIPKLVQSFMSFDEQGVLTFVRYLGLIKNFVGFDTCYHLQSHLRTSGPAGQIEVDGLYIGQDNSEVKIVLVEGKGEDEEFVRNQLFKNAYTLRSKEGFPDQIVVLGVQPYRDDMFYIVEFSVPESRAAGTVEVADIERYSFSQTSLSVWN